MTGHWDAAGFGLVLFVAFLVLLLVHDRACCRRLDQVRGQRDRARRAHRKTLERFAEAVSMAAGDQRSVDAEFDALMTRAFLDGGEA